MLKRFQKAVGIGAIRGPYKNGSQKAKPIYQWHALGYADMKRVIALMYPMLSARRKKQANVLLANPPDPRGFRYSEAALVEIAAIKVPGWKMPKKTGNAIADRAKGFLR